MNTPLRHFARPAPLVMALLLAGCTPEEKITRYKPFFANMEGVQTQTPPVIEADPTGAGPQTTTVGETSLVIENPDGTKTLISRSGLHMMSHIRRTLAEGEVEQLVDQVLSEITRKEYRDRGLDPREAFKTLKEHEKDIALLFARMPLGEHSPNVIMRPIGKNFFRIRITGHAAKGLGRYHGYDMILEKGHWRLRWFN